MKNRPPDFPGYIVKNQPGPPKSLLFFSFLNATKTAHLNTFYIVSFSYSKETTISIVLQKYLPSTMET
jgi:Tfp pilus assembly protein PilX